MEKCYILTTMISVDSRKRNISNDTSYGFSWLFLGARSPRFGFAPKPTTLHPAKLPK
jgi:hypothetical protein